MSGLREELARLAGGHYTCEDCWYSCPLAEDSCSPDGNACNCGLEERMAAIQTFVQAQVDAALAPIVASWKAEELLWREREMDLLRRLGSYEVGAEELIAKQDATVDAAVKAERERCLQLLSKTGATQDGLDWLAAAIRIAALRGERPDGD